jgi:hypothetical protein
VNDLEKFRADSQREGDARLPGTPRFHHADARFYLATGILIFIGALVLAQTAYAMYSGCANRQAVLDGFGLFDAGFMTLAGAISAFYFSDQSRSH